LKASLFVTCIVDQFYPKIGESTFGILNRLGIEVDFPKGQACCGQPMFNSGYWNDSKPLAKKFLQDFSDSEYIVLPSGSCAAMVSKFYAEILKDEDAALREWEQISPRIFELSDFIFNVLKIDDLNQFVTPNSPSGVLKIAYHQACHALRELNILNQPLTLLGSLSNVELVNFDQEDVCCGFGGTFSVKFPEISGAMLSDKIHALRNSKAEILTSVDSSCLMHIRGGIEKAGDKIKVMHFAEILHDRLG